MQKLFAEPLFQFAVFGLLLLIVLELMAPEQLLSESPTEIIVDDANLQRYLQFQQKIFKADEAEKALSSMAAMDKQRLIEDYIRDEALYREALALGLDANDEIIRRRLIQKMEYLAQGFYDDVPALPETALADYFVANQEQYAIDAAITFTHVFLPVRTRAQIEGGAMTDQAAATLERAQQLLQQLNADAVPFEHAGRYGQRFIYNQNYVERTQEYITTHFGPQFAADIFALGASDLWQGPLQSDYGIHLVLITTKTAARSPQLEEVAQIVLADLQAEQGRQVKARAIQELVEKYTIKDVRPDASN